MENVAKADKNRIGPYCCVFAIAMDRGERNVKGQQQTKRPYSTNTEVWMSDFLWPFFANYSYEEMMSSVLDVLIETQEQEHLVTQIDVPDELLQSFGKQCREHQLINDDGYFHSSHQLVNFFCRK